MSYYYKKYFYLKIKEIISYPILFVILRSLKFLSKLFYILFLVKVFCIENVILK